MSSRRHTQRHIGQVLAAGVLAAAATLAPASASAYQYFGSWTQLVTRANGTCLASGGLGSYLENNAPCSQADLTQFFRFNNGTISDYSANCVDETSGDHGWGYTDWIQIERCNGASGQWWTQDSNGEFHNVSSGWCLDGDRWEVCEPAAAGGVCFPGPDYAYPERCNGNDSEEKFDGVTAGPNPLQYIGYTIRGYVPWNGGDYVLDVRDNGRSNGTPVDLAQQNGTTAQVWWYEPSTLLIHLSFSNNMCLQKPPGINANGTLLEIRTCTGAKNQQWSQDVQAWSWDWGTWSSKPYAVTYVNAESQTCIDAPARNFNSPIVQVYTCNGNINQYWMGPWGE